MEKTELSYTVDGNVVGTASVENRMGIPQKTKNRVVI